MTQLKTEKTNDVIIIGENPTFIPEKQINLERGMVVDILSVKYEILSVDHSTGQILMRAM